MRCLYSTTYYCLLVNCLENPYLSSEQELIGVDSDDSMKRIISASIFAFRARIQSSNNPIIQCMVNSIASLVSNVWKWWRVTLYTRPVTM